ncbi:MAG: glucose-6-phosphate isomerase [Candidatus Brocadiales bacterium]
MSKETQSIHLDFNNMMAERVGVDKAQGITRAEIEAIRGRAANCFKDLMEERSRGLHPFLDLPHDKETVAKVSKVANDLKEWAEDFVLLGIGGSALGNIALHMALNDPLYNELLEVRKGCPRVHVIDTIDPDIFEGLLRLINLEKTVFNIISKSGTTVETVAQFLIVRDFLRKRLGSDYGRNFIATTDPVDGALRRIAHQEGYTTLDIPRGVGGRFSVLTPVGLLSAAVSGIDIEAILSGAAYMDNRCQSDDIKQNPALTNAVLQYVSYYKGRHISVMMPYSSKLEGVAEWFCQLWAESLGKKLSVDGEVVHCGPTPIRSLGPTDQHSQLQLYMEGPFDKVITFLAVGRFEPSIKIPIDVQDKDLAHLTGHSLEELMEAERLGTQAALTESGRPNCTIYLPEISAFYIGQLLYFFELQTALAGKLFGVNPFDQPGVEAGKVNTNALLGKKGLENRKKELEESYRRRKGRETGDENIV